MKNINIQIIIVIGAAGLIITPVSADQQFDRISQMEKGERATIHAAPKAVPKVEQGVIRRPSLEYKSEKLRDPFRKYLSESEVGIGALIPEEQESKELPSELKESFTIQGVIWGGRFPQAIINNKVVKAGDDVSGARIIEINANNISVLFEDRVYNVPLSTLDKLLEGSKGGKDEK
jgi:hypothetical protein